MFSVMQFVAYPPLTGVTDSLVTYLLIFSAAQFL